ncbi:MAG TPA: hypothetical protein VIL85_11400 [Thermomicrobiales bacterium]|jgi:hypothetical protein
MSESTHYSSTHTPREAQSLHFKTPPHILRLQAAIRDYDVATLTENPDWQCFHRRHIAGEWWPYAIAGSGYTLVHGGDNRQPASLRQRARLPLSEGETRYRRMAGSDALEWVIAEASDPYMCRDDGTGRYGAHFHWGDMHHSEVVGEDKRALYAARHTWKQASLMSYEELQGYVRHMPAFSLHEEPASQILWGVR